MLHAAVTDAWRHRYSQALASCGVDIVGYDDGDGLARALAGHWGVDLVLLDLDLATPALLARLSASGPRLLAFGNPANAGLALAANLADFLPPDPTEAELTTAVAAALAPAALPGFADLSDRSLAKLGVAGAEVERIAGALSRLERTPVAAPPPLDVGRLRALIRARRARDRFFPAEILGEPAWDMLLDLAVACAENRDVAVSSLCIAAAVPTTTALRWIKSLCDAGLLERRNDPRDARRAFISLSAWVEEAMARYLAQLP